MHDNLANVGEGIREVDLPGLSADEIETILSENANWSGEQFKNFFHSAVELSEIEAKLFSGSGYESDSGYSTYDVSPITSSAPMQFGCRPDVSSSYRSISPALTPVNPSPYISLSSSNPFQFGHAATMHMSLHSSGPVSTPLPHSASPDAEFAFFPPNTPSFHPSLQAPAPLTPSHEAYMVQGGVPHNAFPMQPSPQYQREYQQTTYAAVLPEMRHSQHEAYCSEFADILGDGSRDEAQRRQQVSSSQPLSCHSPNQISIKTEAIEHAPCPPNTVVSTTATTSPTLAPATGPLPLLPATVKLEAMPEESPCSGGSSSASCRLSQLSSGTCEAPPQNAPTSRDSNSTPLQSFLSTCSKIPVLYDLVSSATHPSVVVVTVSTALSALAKQTKGSESEMKQHEVSVVKPPYNVAQLQLQLAELTPTQAEKLANPNLISAAKLVATKHLESLAAVAAQRKEGGKQACVSSPLKSPEKPSQLTSMLAQSKPSPLKRMASSSSTITLKVVPKSQSQQKHQQKQQQQQQLQKSSVSRVGAGSNMKSSQKKKTQWPRSMSKANLLAFRQHILNKLKRGQEESQKSPSQETSLVRLPSDSSVFEADVMCERNLSMPVRCSSEPANLFSHQTHTDSPSSLQTSHSAMDLSPTSLSVPPLHIDTSSGDAEKNPDFNPDILLSSSVLSLPDTLLDNMEMETLGSITSPSEDDFAQFLCDPSPPSSVTSPIDSMELNCIQDFLSGHSEGSTGTNSSFSPLHFSEDSSPIATIMQNSPFVPTTPTTAVQPQSSFTGSQAGEQSTVCSMADVASLFNESINSIANVESLPAATPINLQDNLESVFQRPTDPLLACSSRLHW